MESILFLRFQDVGSLGGTCGLNPENPCSAPVIPVSWAGFWVGEGEGLGPSPKGFFWGG